jgi:hypothetical protein
MFDDQKSEQTVWSCQQHKSENFADYSTLTDRPKSATLPRICLKFRLPFRESYEMMRIQFPLRLAYAMTYNKCQGQTMKKVLLDISNPPFAHGHLYVALSRVTKYQDIKIICMSENNATYSELIE